MTGFFILAISQESQSHPLGGCNDSLKSGISVGLGAGLVNQNTKYRDRSTERPNYNGTSNIGGLGGQFTLCVDATQYLKSMYFYGLSVFVGYSTLEGCHETFLDHLHMSKVCIEQKLFYGISGRVGIVTAYGAPYLMVGFVQSQWEAKTTDKLPSGIGGMHGSAHIKKTLPGFLVGVGMEFPLKARGLSLDISYTYAQYKGTAYKLIVGGGEDNRNASFKPRTHALMAKTKYTF